MKCFLKRFNAVLEQECEICLKQASDSYKEELSKYFANRKEPVEANELFKFFASARDTAINEFVVIGEIREKYEQYDDYLDKLQSYINDQEDKLTEINESLAEE
jgi:hypothetical protein